MKMFRNPREISIGSSPCRYCDASSGRTPTCHYDGTCKKGYPEWKQKNDELRNKENEDRRIREGYRQYLMDRSYKIKKELANKR